MLNGKTLIELATAVTETAARKMDVVADSRNIELRITTQSQDVQPVAAKANVPTLIVNNDIRTDLSTHALNQITEHTGVPAKYAQRMLVSQPRLLEANVNTWLRDEPSLRMVRTLRETGIRGDMLRTRAFLSNRFHRMENDQLLAAVLPELLEAGNGIQVMSSELTDARMYIKVVFPKLEGEVKKGDLVQYGFTLGNSEIGSGALSISPFVYRLICLNGMTLSKDVDDTRMRRAHLGRQLEEGADYFTDETIRADDKALQLKIRDTMKAFMDAGRWQSVLARLQAAAATEHSIDPIKTVERIAELLVLPKEEHNAVLMNFIKDGDLSKWGMLNAVTAVANASDSYDRASELEVAGGRILALPDSDWRKLAKAA